MRPRQDKVLQFQIKESIQHTGAPQREWGCLPRRSIQCQDCEKAVLAKDPNKRLGAEPLQQFSSTAGPAYASLASRRDFNDAEACRRVDAAGVLRITPQA